VIHFLTVYAALIAVIVIVLLVLTVLFFILAAICQGATVRASAEHDADRPWDLGRAWTAGVLTMWPVIRFRLLIVALGLPILLLAIGLTAATISAFANDNVGLGVALLVISLLLLLPVIAYGIYLHILDRLGSRALVLDQLGARASIVRAHRLLLKRLGRTLLVWLLSIAVAFVLGIVTACAFAIVFLPLVLAGSLFAANNSSAVVPLIVLGAIVALPISLLVAGFLSAQSSTYWTLAFRRLDLDPVPVAYNPQMPPPTAPA
jgi:hypothetical protein